MAQSNAAKPTQGPRPLQGYGDHGPNTFCVKCWSRAIDADGDGNGGEGESRRNRCSERLGEKRTAPTPEPWGEAQTTGQRYLRRSWSGATQIQTPSPPLRPDSSETERATPPSEGTPLPKNERDGPERRSLLPSPTAADLMDGSSKSGAVFQDRPALIGQSFPLSSKNNNISGEEHKGALQPLPQPPPPSPPSNLLASDTDIANSTTCVDGEAADQEAEHGIASRKEDYSKNWCSGSNQDKRRERKRLFANLQTLIDERMVRVLDKNIQKEVEGILSGIAS